MSLFISIMLLAFAGILATIAVATEQKGGYRNAWLAAIWGIAAYILLGIGAFFTYYTYVIQSAEKTAQAVPPPVIPLSLSKPYSIEVELSAIQVQKSLVSSFCWLAYYSQHGKTLSPITIVMFLQLVNNQPAPAMISRLTVELQVSNGDWLKLIHMPIRGNQVFVPKGADLKQAHPWALETNGFDYLISDRAIPPHEPVRGWAFFEIPAFLTIPQGTEIRYRFQVEDTNGTEFIYTTESSAIGSKGVDLEQTQSKLMHFGPVQDISTYKRVYYSTPIR